MPPVDDDPPGINGDAVRRYFAENVPGVLDPRELTFEVISGGRSNLTYRVSAETGPERWILRRPPLAHVLPTAHDMSREYRVLTTLQGSRVPVPTVVSLCEDAGVTGAPFYVMNYVDGVVLREPAQTAALTPAQRTSCADALIDVLVELHGIDYHAVGLQNWGRPEGYLDRQVRRWLEQWERSKTRELPLVDEIGRRLLAGLPPDSDGVIVHGDYRLDNTMLASDDPGRIVAVLDWEMSTLGDPLSDLALLLTYWTDPPGGGNGFTSAAVGRSLTALPGFPTRREIAERYSSLSGRSIELVAYYLTLAYLKLAIILEGIHARYLKGATVGTGFDNVGADVESLVEASFEVARNSGIPALARR